MTESSRRACSGDGRTNTDRGEGRGSGLCDDGDQLLGLQVDGQEAVTLLSNCFDHALRKCLHLQQHDTLMRIRHM